MSRNLPELPSCQWLRSSNRIQPDEQGLSRFVSDERGDISRLAARHHLFQRLALGLLVGVEQLRSLRRQQRQSPIKRGFGRAMAEDEYLLGVDVILAKQISQVHSPSVFFIRSLTLSNNSSTVPLFLASRAFALSSLRCSLTSRRCCFCSGVSFFGMLALSYSLELSSSSSSGAVSPST